MVNLITQQQKKVPSHTVLITLEPAGESAKFLACSLKESTATRVFFFQIFKTCLSLSNLSRYQETAKTKTAASKLVQFQTQ